MPTELHPPGSGWKRIWLAQGTLRDPNSLLTDLDPGAGVSYLTETAASSLVNVTSDGNDRRGADAAATYTFPLFDAAGNRLDCSTPWQIEFWLELVSVTQGSDIFPFVGLTNAADFSGVWLISGLDLDLGGGPDQRHDCTAAAATNSAAQADGTYLHATLTHTKGRVSHMTGVVFDSAVAVLNTFTYSADEACTGNLFYCVGFGRSGAGADKDTAIRAYYRGPILQAPEGYVSS